MRLAVDLDGVFFDFTGKIHSLIPEIPLHPAEADVALYLKNTDKMNLFNKLMVSETFFSSLPVYPGMEEVVPILNRNDFYIVSARRKPVQDATRQQVYNLGLEPADFLFTARKGNAIEDYQLDIMIEDQVRYAQQVSPRVTVVMPRRSYNSHWVDKKDIIVYNKPSELVKILLELEALYV